MTCWLRPQEWAGQNWNVGLPAGPGLFLFPQERGHPPVATFLLGLFSHDKPCSLIRRGNERCLTRRLLSCHGNFLKSQRGPGLCGPSSLPGSGASPGCALRSLRPRSLRAGLEPGGTRGPPGTSSGQRYFLPFQIAFPITK